MKGTKCFENDVELYLHLDKETRIVRMTMLDKHMKLCNKCAQKFTALKELKSLLRNCNSDIKAPEHLKERINKSLVAMAGQQDFIALGENGNNIQLQDLQPYRHESPADSNHNTVRIVNDQIPVNRPEP